MEIIMHYAPLSADFVMDPLKKQELAEGEKRTPPSSTAAIGTHRTNGKFQSGWKILSGQRGAMSLCRLLLLESIIAVLMVSAHSARADTFDVVTKLQDTSAVTVWRIDEPNVQQERTDYPAIKFLPGDKIKVDAGGCVQTGGFGRTWKRYVDPSGPNADRLYHGLIWIPGINEKLTRIQSFGLNKEYQIGSPLSGDINLRHLFLRLGYEDDNYRDNGYWSHDDGTDDQCKNVDHAFIIVSIGHAGALPPNPRQFVGVEPQNFRCQAAWAFKNFDTSELSWSSFTNAFKLGFFDYLDPAMWITFLAGRSLGSNGNCEGMSLLSVVGEDQFVVADIKESFWANYKSQVPTPSLAFDINVAHWKQLSAYFLRNWAGSIFNKPLTNAEAIERDLTKADYNYGLLTLLHGSGGHVLVPLRVSRAGEQTLIDVYDPNRPCDSIPDKASYPKVTINGDTWSYDMGGGDGIWSQSGYGLGYIPYVGEDEWSDLGTDLKGIAKVIFGSDVTVEQVSDSAGRRLFVEGRPGVIDPSTNGLSRSVLHLPMYSASSEPKRPRSGGARFALDYAISVPSAIASQGQQIEDEYEKDYAGSGEIYVVLDGKLSDLTFTLSGTNPARPIRSLVSLSGKFFELSSVATTSTVVHPSLVIHSLSDLASGVTIQDRAGAPLKVTLAYGSRQTNTVRIQKADEFLANAATKVRVAATNGEMELLTAGPRVETQIRTQAIDIRGTATTIPARPFTLLPLN
jgi:hypothetical protein